jgi:hypothetical protein
VTASSPGAAGLLLTLAFTTAACGRADGTDSWDGTTIDSAGIAIVQNGEYGVWGGTPEWSLHEVLRIGNELDPDYQFGNIGGIAPLSDGRLVVLDQQAQNLRVYDAAGRFVATFASRGSGPGELDGATTVLSGPADTTYVPGWGGVDIFAPDGESVGSYGLDRLWGRPDFWATMPSGRLFHLKKPSMPGQPRADSLDSIIELGSEGIAIDTLFRMPPGEGVTFAPSGRVLLRMYAREPIWQPYGDDGFLLGWNDEYTIYHYGTDGSLLRIIRKPLERREVSPTDESVVTEVLSRAWSALGMPPQGVEWYKDGLSFEPYFPAFSRVLVGPEGTVWVQHLLAPSQLTAEGHKPTYPYVEIGSDEWAVFDADGRFMGSIDFPRNYEPLLFRESRVYGIWRDELDIQHVVVLSVE